MKRCGRCNKRWCGTNRRLIKLYGAAAFDDKLGLDAMIDRVTFGSKKCRDKGSKR